MGIIKTLLTATSLVGGGFGGTETFLKDDGSINEDNAKKFTTVFGIISTIISAGYVSKEVRTHQMRERYEERQKDESKNETDELIASIRQQAFQEEKYETAKKEVNEFSAALDACTDEQLEELYIKANLLEAEKNQKNNNKTV